MPEPLFRYFSKSSALFFEGKAQYHTTTYGRFDEVALLRQGFPPSLCGATEDTAEDTPSFY